MKKLLLVIGAIHSVACLPLYPQSGSPVRPLSAEDGEKWVIRWDRSDDFNGDQIDWRKWQKTPENFSAWTWNNERNASVSDGFLKLTMCFDERASQESKPNASKTHPHFTSAMLKSYRTGVYGYYEARIKGAPMFPGVCPAFWLYSRIDDSLEQRGAVRYSEVDVVEITQRGGHEEGNERITDHNLHTIQSNGKKGIAGREWQRPNDPRYREKQANEYHAPFDPRDDFHTYGCRVGKREIIWYVDGVEVGRKPNEFWHREMNVVLSLGLRAPYATFTANRLVENPDKNPEGFPTSALVDYVRVWDLVDSVSLE